MIAQAQLKEQLMDFETAKRTLTELMWEVDLESMSALDLATDLEFSKEIDLEPL